MSLFPSLTTANFSHDGPNLLTELILLNKYKALPPFVWRKNSSIQKEWGKTLVSVKFMLKKLNITIEQVLLFLHQTKRTGLECKDFGLVRWYLNQGKLDAAFPLQVLIEYYKNLYISKNIEDIEKNQQDGVYKSTSEAVLPSDKKFFKLKRK